MSAGTTIDARAMTRALLLAGVGGLGALPVREGGSDPLALLVWLACWAAAAGCLAGAFCFRLWPLGLVVPATWMVLLGGVDAAAERDLPTPFFACLAWTGLFAAGYGIGSFGAERTGPGGGWRHAALLLAAGALLVGLPLAGGIEGEPWPLGTAALLLDLSPASLLVECAGLDWMRHPVVYELVGTSRMDPAVRVAYRGSLAGPVVLLVGCAIAFAGRGLGRRVSVGNPDPSHDSDP